MGSNKATSEDGENAKTTLAGARAKKPRKPQVKRAEMAPARVAQVAVAARNAEDAAEMLGCDITTYYRHLRKPEVLEEMRKLSPVVIAPAFLGLLRLARSGDWRAIAQIVNSPLMQAWLLGSPRGQAEAAATDAARITGEEIEKRVRALFQ